MKAKAEDDYECLNCDTEIPIGTEFELDITEFGPNNPFCDESCRDTYAEKQHKQFLERYYGG